MPIQKVVKPQPKHRKQARRSTNIVPELRVNGIWLEQHGFTAGCKVEITVRHNELVIILANQPSQS